ncbi:hypothetical protein D6833_12640 [Candidatus Parcubacteria bacterium]|nr:MAG: hypothetical protein D6833_12640 [Candidatus Parcubacteria bacterium]
MTTRDTFALQKLPSSQWMTREEIRSQAKNHPFLWLPSPILRWLYTQDLSVTAFAVYLEYWMDAACRKDSHLVSRLSVSVLAKRLGVAETTIQRANRQLIKAGLIRRQSAQKTHDRSEVASTWLLVPTGLFSEHDVQQLNTATRQAMYKARITENAHPPLPLSHRPPTSVRRIAPREHQETVVPHIASGSRASHLDLKTTVRDASDREKSNDCKHRFVELEQEIKKMKSVLDAYGYRVGSEKYRSLMRPHHGHPSEVIKANIRLGQCLVELKRLKEVQQLNASSNGSVPEKQRTQAPVTVAKLVRQASESDARHSSLPPREVPAKWVQTIRARLEDIPGITNRKQVLDEILFQLSEGVFRGHQWLHGINACLAMVRRNTWRTPYGYHRVYRGGTHAVQRGCSLATH